MTKILIILLLLLFLLAMIATRYRRQIMMGVQVFQMFRKMRAANGVPEKQIHKKDDGAAVPLVKCVKCGTWVPGSNAMKLGGNTYYCSTACVEKSEVRA
jgi:hypothetical protein